MAVVVVTDGEQRSALAAVRSLGRAGHRVHVCAARRSLSGASRHCAGEHRVPDALAEPAAFVRAVAEVCARVGAQVLLPVSEPALLAILPERERFAGVAIPFPDAERFARICDKARVLEAATAHGIATPRRQHVGTKGDAERLDGAALRFPLVVKPFRSVAGSGEARTKTAVAHAPDAASLRRVLAALPDAAWPVMLQERIVGPGIGVFVLLRGGRVAAAFAHRRVREKPPSGGVSVLCESAPLDGALLGDFGWEGVAMVEYKLDAATGTPYLMEINGRLWGSLQLAVDAGVDFPRLLVEMALGVPFPPVTTYGVGVRSRWEWGEVDHLVARLRGSGAPLPPDAPGRGRALADFFRGWGRGTHAQVLRRDDPRPFLRETLDWLRRR